MGEDGGFAQVRMVWTAGFVETIRMHVVGCRVGVTAKWSFGKVRGLMRCVIDGVWGCLAGNVWMLLGVVGMVAQQVSTEMAMLRVTGLGMLVGLEDREQGGWLLQPSAGRSSVWSCVATCGRMVGVLQTLAGSTRWSASASGTLNAWGQHGYMRFAFKDVGYG